MGKHSPDMEDRIQQLAAIARRLNPDEAERARLTEQVVAYANQFINNIPRTPAYNFNPENGRGLLTSPITEEGIALEEALALLRDQVDGQGLNPASDRFFGYIPGGGLYHSALGDYLAAVTNRYAGYFFPSPGAVRIENQLLKWMAGVIGYPNTAAGNLTSGGSIAHLIGIVAARDAHAIIGERTGTAVIYLTDQTHHSVAKAIHIAGLSACVKRMVPVDGRYRLDAAALENMIDADKAAGLHPWLIIASAGTTNTGAVDPLPAISQIAHAHGLWLHVDGAYGAFFALCSPGWQRLAGMELADSIVMDPHKTLFLPYGTGAVLVKDAAHLLASFAADADYMQDGRAHLDELSPADASPELTKHFRGLRLWLPLKLLGVAPFRAALEEKLLLTEYFHHKIQTVPGFKAGPPPDLAVATFWYEPEGRDANAFNERLVEQVQRDGRVFLTSTRLADRFVLRLAVGVFRSHLTAVDQTIAVVTELAQKLAAEG